jgi:hypothetical protein
MQRADFEKKRVEHEQSQAQLELERSELVADRAAFETQKASQAEADSTTISDALSELEEELARLDATAPEAAPLPESDEPESADDLDAKSDDPVSTLGNWDMLWSEAASNGEPEEATPIADVTDSDVVEFKLSGELVESADDVVESAEDVVESEADVFASAEGSESESSVDEGFDTDDDEEYGESRYARKSRHLPRIEDDHGSPAVGLRDAILGAHNKRKGGSA